MDDVSGLADKSSDFSSFLTVSRKFGYISLYIFHILYPNKSPRLITSQTKILNIFPLSIQLGSISKLLSNNCNRETFNYIPSRDLWINRPYVEISNEQNSGCLTIDCRNSGLAKYRTKADNKFEQFCYFNQKIKKNCLINFLLKESILTT